MKTETCTKRPAAERGTANYGWLDARYTFSFGGYLDPDHMGFKSLRVMNNDTIAPDGGFPPHPHESMEIFTYIVEGQLAHRDSMGNEAVIQAGDLQYMSAGNGIRHSEYNPSSTDKTTLYQIWIQPREPGGAPRYAEKPLRESAREDELILLFSGDGRDGSTEIRQEAEIYFAQTGEGAKLSVPASATSPHIWIQVIEGHLLVKGESLESGDGLAIEDHPDILPLISKEPTKFLLFRLS